MRVRVFSLALQILTRDRCVCGTTVDTASSVITEHRSDITQKRNGGGGKKTSVRGVMFLFCFEGVWADRHGRQLSIGETLSPNHYSFSTLPSSFELLISCTSFSSMISSVFSTPAIFLRQVVIKCREKFVLN